MRARTFKLGAETVTLPRGTRVLLKTDLRGEDGFLHRSSTAATVREVSKNSYVLETASGRFLRAERDQIRMAREDLLEEIGKRQWDLRRLRASVMYEAVVGSHAWGLADENSDEDIRGWFLLPFDDLLGIWDSPDEIQDPDSDAAYWELEKLLYQALRADANTLECLWSPIRRKVTPLGDRLLEIRQSFLSMNVLGSFGRYAESQFRKIGRAERRNQAILELLEAVEKKGVGDLESAASFLRTRRFAPTMEDAQGEVRAAVRSLFDRGLLSDSTFEALVRAVADGRGRELSPPPHRPKNAYNLLRLLHSCVHCLRTGEPLIQVQGGLRNTLLAIKSQQMPIAVVIERARDVAREIEAAAKESKLPEEPDFRAADEFLKLARRQSARVSLGIELEVGRGASERFRRDEYHPDLFPVPLPPDVHPDALERFLARNLWPGPPETRVPLLWLALSGAHAYGFPSLDSDLDLKGVHALPARSLLGLREPPKSIDWLGEWEGREVDFSSNDLGQAARLLLKGNGNLFERFLGPFPVVATPAGHRLRALAEGALNRKVYHHYGGFLRAMTREYRLESANGVRKVKRLLYAYRVALTGIHLLLTGRLVTDVNALYECHGFPRVVELVRLKRERESGTLPAEDKTPFLEDLDRLERALAEAESRSVLPEEAPNREELERFVIEERLRS